MRKARLEAFSQGLHAFVALPWFIPDRCMERTLQNKGPGV